MKFILSFLVLIILNFQSCKEPENTVKVTALKTKIPERKTTLELSEAFKNYWYAGKAEITSYKLSQFRYGEERNGKAVLVFVTEPFLQKEQVKANGNLPSNIPVLKLNSTKKFNTGVYPYSIMQSIFYPVANNQNALKISCSVQEWCGHAYTQLNNREQFEIRSHSYFKTEADQNFTLAKAPLENELWTQLRINPKSLPVGRFKIIPALEFIRLKHKPIIAYNAIGTLTKNSYTLKYTTLNRTLTIVFNPSFPYIIEEWQETTNGLTSKGTKLKTIKSAYWNKNSNKDKVLRKTLQLD